MGSRSNPSSARPPPSGHHLHVLLVSADLGLGWNGAFLFPPPKVRPTPWPGEIREGGMGSCILLRTARRREKGWITRACLKYSLVVVLSLSCAAIKMRLSGGGRKIRRGTINWEPPVARQKYRLQSTLAESECEAQDKNSRRRVWAPSVQ